MSFFEQVALAPSDPIFGLVNAYNQDKHPKKLSFVVGYYRTEEGKTPVMSAVLEAEKRVVEKVMDKEYLPIEGDGEYLGQIGKLVFGDFWQRQEKRFVAAQTVGGTGALRLMGDFGLKELGQRIWLSDPTWPNHSGIFKRAGFAIETYPYYDYNKQSLDFERLVQAFEKLPERAIVLLHANCHNPTGMDLNLSQWKELSALFSRKKLFPFFDMAYQGFGDGLDKDALGVRLFAENGHEMALAYSCAKNFSLYGERVGALFILSDSDKWTENVRSQLRVLIRTNYSNPPRHGAAIVKEVLGTSKLEKLWLSELSEMRARMQEMRTLFCDALKSKIPQKDWGFIQKTKGLFCYTGLSKKEVEKLAKEYGIFMPNDGRINITALRRSALNYIVDAIAEL